MKVVGDVVQYILNMGASVMLPIMIFIIALIFRVKASKALRSALTIGIGMVGINLVINLLTTNIGPAAQAMVKRFGFHLTVIDVGWPSAAAGAWGQPISSILIPILLVTNLVLLITGITKTLDIDIWNYWHMVAAGSVAYIVTQSWIFSIISAILYMIFCLLIADWTAKDVQEFYGLEGISFPTGSSDAFGLLGIPISWVVSKIPGLGKIDVDAETIPNVQVFRPADGNETSAAWKVALETLDKPTILVLSRQNLDTLPISKEKVFDGVEKGGYVVQEAESEADGILIATGSEVGLALKAKEELQKKGKDVSVVSLPSWERFEAQSEEYKNTVISPELKKRMTIEAGTTYGWAKYAGDHGVMIGIDEFGMSAPSDIVLRELGMSVENIVSRYLEM